MKPLTDVIGARNLQVQRLPALGIALVMAETLYKFHSFTAELIAFAATWYVLDAAVRGLGGVWRRDPADQERRRSPSRRPGEEPM